LSRPEPQPAGASSLSILAKCREVTLGGSGSGRRFRWQDPKRTVEQCRSLDAGRWAREGIIAAGMRGEGACVWLDPSTGEQRCSISYRTDLSSDGSGWVELSYRVGEPAQAIAYRVQLQTTRPNFGGVRWWFTCPLSVRGQACGRRVKKLYLVGRYFGCRHCHGLTYRSSQQAHQDERLDASMWALMIRHGIQPSPGLTPALLGRSIRKRLQGG